MPPETWVTIQEGRGKLFMQVLTEFIAVATRRLGLPAATVRRRVEFYASLEVYTPAVGDLLAAIDLHRLHQLSIWDALIVRAAQASGCRTLYTEDLQNGRRFDGLRRSRLDVVTEDQRVDRPQLTVHQHPDRRGLGRSVLRAPSRRAGNRHRPQPGKDQTVPFRMAETLLRRAAEPKALWRIDGPHIAGIERYGDEYVARIKALLDAAQPRYLTSRPAISDSSRSPMN